MLSSDIVQKRQTVLETWVELEELEDIFYKYQIDRDMFQKSFGTRIVDYFVAVFLDEVEAGNCPAVSAMLHFFQNKNLELSDIYILCDCLKETIVEMSPSDSRKTFDIFRKNFAGVIRSYIKISTDFVSEKNKIPSTGQEEGKVVDSEPRAHLSNEISIDEHIDKSGLMLFMEGDAEMVRDIVDNLADFCDSCFDENLDNQKLVAISSIFSTIGLYEFSELFQALSEIQIPNNSCYMFMGLANDMRIFKSNLLDVKLEQSIISNIRQLQALLPSEMQDEGDMELF